MDFLDPKKHHRHMIRLTIGYILIAAAILITTTILLYAAYGFGVGKNGQIIQNGLVFVSSTPGGSQIYLNGKLESAKTNARLQLPSGEYTFEITHTGYRPWQRAVTVEGGQVERFDYPFLFPTNLVTSTVQAYQSAPGLATQSPDHRWLLVQQSNDFTDFDEFDLKNPKTPATVVTVPSTAYTPVSGTQSWQLVEWSTDNQHVLLKHVFGNSSEYVLVDRADPTQSINLTRTLGVNPTQISLRDKKFDQYYLFFANTGELQTASLASPQPAADLVNVLAYKSYGSDVMLYVTTDGAPAGKVVFKLTQNGATYTLRTAAANTQYLLNLTQYNGDWYVAVGASSESKLYIYKNPVNQLTASPPLLVPIEILKVKNPTYVSFSDNAQFIMEENGTQFAVYDAQYDKNYSYTTNLPLDAPQAHATWMDGDRLDYVSGGKLVVFDYDHANAQTLMTASATYLPFFDPSYKFVDTLAPSQAAATQTVLTSTSLVAGP